MLHRLLIVLGQLLQGRTIAFQNGRRRVNILLPIQLLLVLDPLKLRSQLPQCLSLFINISDDVVNVMLFRLEGLVVLDFSVDFLRFRFIPCSMLSLN